MALITGSWTGFDALCISSLLLPKSSGFFRKRASPTFPNCDSVTVSQVKPESISLENLKFLSSQNYTVENGDLRFRNTYSGGRSD